MTEVPISYQWTGFYMIGTSVIKELIVIRSLVNFYFSLMVICSLAASNKSLKRKATEIEKQIVEVLE